VLGYIESGYVCVPEGAAFTNDFITECESFTADNSHIHDDQIDPMVDAIGDLLANRKFDIEAML
jgi:predicted phage terminase large subunit-like protein